MRLKSKKTLALLFLIITLTITALYICLYVFLMDNQTINTSFAAKIIQPYPYTNTQIITNEDLSSYNYHNFMQTLPYIGCSIILIVVIAFFSFTYVLQKLQRNQHLRIAQNIAKLKDTELNKNDDFYQELLHIKEWMMQYSEDHERLYTYMTHEQKNMMMLIKSRLHADSDPLLIQDIQHLHNSIEDLLTLFSQEETTLETMDFSLIVAQLTDQYRHVYPSLSFTFDEDCDYHMDGKEYWLKRALANILDNAIKYGEKQPIQVQLSVQHDTIQCKVIDYGKGIPKEQLQTIFAYRYRIQPLKKDGFGIGLSLVMHVCDLCDGYVWVNSKEQEGSCFQLCFPCKH